MATINPYLNYKDKCEEAFELYRSVFGGEYSAVIRMTDIDCGQPVPEGAENLIMHISLPIGGNVLMGSDCPDGFGPQITVGNNYAVSVTAESREDADRIFAGLSAGGTETMPMGDAPWGAYFGMVKDKFDIDWMVSFGPENS